MDVTYNFTAGTRAVADQVDRNFADVKSAVDPLETDVATIKNQLTSGIILPDGSVDFTRLQSYATYVVSNATNATPIVITAVAHGFLTGDKVYINGVGGNTAANGTFTITKLGVDTFSLDGSVGNGAFSSNGTAIIYPSAYDNLVNKVYADTKQILNLGTVTTETTLTTGKITLADFSGAVNLVMPSNLPLGVEHTAVVNFTTSSTSQPTISTSGTLKWSDKNGGKAPTAYSTSSGVRNILTFKTHDNGITWEAEYMSYGGVETAFTFPNLSANGTLGSASAAVSGSSTYSGQDYYYAVDSIISPPWTTACGLTTSTAYYIWYNPKPFKVTQYNYRNRTLDYGTTYTPTAGTFYYSDDGVNWVLEQNFTNNVTAENAYWNVPISEINQGYHKYRKAVYTATSGAYGGIYYVLVESRPVGYTITT